MEKLIARHCAPALAGIKPSSIVTCKKNVGVDIHNEIYKLNRQLNKKDIYIRILCECGKRALVIVYRKSVLEKHLCEKNNSAFLSGYGYGGAASLDEYFAILTSCLGCDCFPHEIGVFLGYPLHDIYCFINHRNEGCIFTGDWKVYHNAEEAIKLFSRYDACKRAVVKKLEAGKTLAQIFCAA